MPRTVLAAALALAVVSASASSPQARAAGPYDDLLKHAPSDTNTLALLNAKAAFSSPLAQAEKWIEKGQGQQGGGLGFVPQEAELVVIAAEINLNVLRRDFQVG